MKTDLLLKRGILRSLIVCLIFSIPARGDYQIKEHTIDGGGGKSQSGTYVLFGTTGQPDAADSQSETYRLLGGFQPQGSGCFVDLEDFARFIGQWLQSGDDLTADLYKDQTNTVDLYDFALFSEEWLLNCPIGWPLR